MRKSKSVYKSRKKKTKIKSSKKTKHRSKSKSIRKRKIIDNKRKSKKLKGGNNNITIGGKVFIDNNNITIGGEVFIYDKNVFIFDNLFKKKIIGYLKNGILNIKKYDERIRHLILYANNNSQDLLNLYKLNSKYYSEQSTFSIILEKKSKNNTDHALQIINNDRARYLLQHDVNLKEFINDEKVVLIAVKNNGLALEFADSNLRKNYAVVLAAVQNNGLALQFANSKMNNYNNVVLAAVNNDGLALQFVKSKLKNYNNVVLAAVQNNGQALKFADSNSINTQLYKQVVLAAIKNIFQNIHDDSNIQTRIIKLIKSNKLINDEEFIKELINKYPILYKIIDYLENDMYNTGEPLNKELEKIYNCSSYNIKEIIKNKLILKNKNYCPEINKQSLIEIFKNNVENDYMALKNATYINDEDFFCYLLIRNDEIIEAKLEKELRDKSKTTPSSEQYEEYKEKKKLEYKDLIKKTGFFDIIKDKEVVLAAINNNAMALNFAHSKLRENKEVILAAVNKNGLVLELANSVLRNNEEVVLAAVENNGLALEFADSNLIKNKTVVLAAINNNPLALKFAHTELTKDMDVVLAAIKKNRAAIRFIDESLVSHTFYNFLVNKL